MNYHVILICAIATALYSYDDVTVSCTTAEDSLHEVLFDKYNPQVRPVRDGNNVVRVNMSMSLVQLLRVDDKEQVITVNVWLYQMWHDYRLSWDPHDYENISYILAKAGNIWYPDTSLYTSSDQASQRHPYVIIDSFRLRIESDGTVFAQTPCNWNIPCNMDVSNFPNDKQRCDISVGMWSHTALQVDCHPISGEVAKELYTPSNDWVVTSTSVNKDYSHDIYGNGPFAYVDFTLFLNRKPLFYLLNLCIPSVLLSFLSTLIFYFPPDSADKVPHGLSVLLTIFIFDILVIDIMPPSSDHIPTTTIYLFTNMITTGVSIILSAGIIDMHRWKGDLRGWRRDLLLWVASALKVSMESVAAKKLLRRNTRQSRAVRLKNYTGISPERGNGYRNTVMSNHEDGTSGVQRKQYDIKAVLKHLEKVESKLEELANKDNVVKIDSDWKLLAYVLNKICFIIVLCIVITTSIWTFLAGVNSEHDPTDH